MSSNGLYIIHLLIDTTDDGSSFILRWKKDYMTLMEPSVEANELKSIINKDNSLSSMNQTIDTIINKHHIIIHKSCIYKILSKNEIMINDNCIKSYLFEKHEPNIILTAKDVELMDDIFEDIIIITDSYISETLRKSLFKCGAVALISRSTKNTDIPMMKNKEFFKSLYNHISNGLSLQLSLSHSLKNLNTLNNCPPYELYINNF